MRSLLRSGRKPYALILPDGASNSRATSPAYPAWRPSARLPYIPIDLKPDDTGSTHSLCSHPHQLILDGAPRGPASPALRPLNRNSDGGRS